MATRRQGFTPGEFGAGKAHLALPQRNLGLGLGLGLLGAAVLGLGGSQPGPDLQIVEPGDHGAGLDHIAFRHRESGAESFPQQLHFLVCAHITACDQFLARKNKRITFAVADIFSVDYINRFVRVGAVLDFPRH